MSRIFIVSVYAPTIPSYAASFVPRYVTAVVIDPKTEAISVEERMPVRCEASSRGIQSRQMAVAMAVPAGGKRQLDPATSSCEEGRCGRVRKRATHQPHSQSPQTTTQTR